MTIRIKVSEDQRFGKSYLKRLKASLASEIRNLRSSELLLLPKCPLFDQLFDLANFFDASDR